MRKVTFSCLYRVFFVSHPTIRSVAAGRAQSVRANTRGGARENGDGGRRLARAACGTDGAQSGVGFSLFFTLRLAKVKLESKPHRIEFKFFSRVFDKLVLFLLFSFKQVLVLLTFLAFCFDSHPTTTHAHRWAKLRQNPKPPISFASCSGIYRSHMRKQT
jgi:hypothetical protein